MITSKLRIGLLLLAACGAIWASGCGGGGSDKKGKQLPAQQAAALQRELDSVQRRFEFGDGACSDIQSGSRADVRSILASIPSDVDSDVRDSLRKSFDRLWALSSSQCDTAKNQRTTPQPTPQPSPPTPTQTQPRTQTETTPTQTQTQPKKPKKPKDNGPGGNGGADFGGGQD
jgi:hypothetical protein